MITYIYICIIVCASASGGRRFAAARDDERRRGETGEIPAHLHRGPYGVGTPVNLHMKLWAECYLDCSYIHVIFNLFLQDSGPDEAEEVRHGRRRKRKPEASCMCMCILPYNLFNS